MWIYVLYLALLAGVVFLSIKLGDYVDLLDKKTKISGAFIGGVMLAAVTSLPELFTSGSAVLLVHQNDLVIGNILGSNVFNMIVLGLGIIIFFKKFKEGVITSWHIVLMIMCFGFYALTAYAVFFPNAQLIFRIYIPGLDKSFGFLNIISLFILVAYIILLIKQPKTSEEDEEAEEKPQDESKLSVKMIILLFSICAVLLIGVSIGITYVTDIVAENLGLGKTVAGALLLGVATSLPEMVSCFTLMHKKNFDAAFGDITGSNVFNFTILGIADILSVNDCIFAGNSQVTVYMICSIISWLALTLIIIFKFRQKGTTSNKWAFFYIPLSVVIIASYICTIVFNM